MASIIYIPEENDLTHRFVALLETAIPKKRFEIFRSIAELSARLVIPPLNVKVAVLFAITRAEIMRILLLRDLIADLKSLVVLADDDRDTIMKTHILRPRYVAWLDADFGTVVSVLKNMVDLYDISQSGREDDRNHGGVNTENKEEIYG